MLTSMFENTSSPAPIRSLFAKSSTSRRAARSRRAASIGAREALTRANAEENQRQRRAARRSIVDDEATQ